MSAGYIRHRGKTSWELNFEAGRDPATGKRQIQYASFRGTKRHKTAVGINADLAGAAGS
jgi:hypothetical protein